MSDVTPVKKVAKKAVAKPVEKSYVALVNITVNENSYVAGDVVPGAEAWPTVDAWVRAKFLKEA